MSTPIRAGVLLGILVTVWQFVIGFTGWYKDPVMMNAFFLVVVFEIVIVLWALKQTAPGATYGQQIVNGLVLSLVAGPIIICSSLVFTTLVFPNYFKEMEAVQTQMLKAQGLSEADIAAGLAAGAAMQTPLMNAVMGFVGTVVTAVIVSAVAGSFWRKK